MPRARRLPATATRFSRTFGVKRSQRDDWFDPLLGKDTKLFVDPFQIFVEEGRRWAGAHDRLMEFFNVVMALVARGRHDTASIHWRKAKGLLLFKEPAEFCLGYGDATVLGTGTGPELGKAMLKAANDTIALGLEQFEHFEELAILGALVGPDRISDMVCNVLKAEFIRYTQVVARRHRLPTAPVPVRNASWDVASARWSHAVVELPANPFPRRALGVLLTPKRFLRRLPSLEPIGFWEWAWATESAQLRNDFNYEIARHVNHEEVARLARQRNNLLRRYVRRLEENPPAPYDLEADPSFLVKPEEGGREIAEALGRQEIGTEEEFTAFVDLVVQTFKHTVETRCWRLLWSDDKPRPEASAQQLFQVGAVLGCRLSDVDLSPEANAGRGPVDFKLSRGWRLKALIEVKLAKSTSFWRNLEAQPVTYAKAEGTQVAYFVVVQFSERDKRPDFVERAERLMALDRPATTPG